MVLSEDILKEIDEVQAMIPDPSQAFFFYWLKF
jgi:hypothetical protein